MEHDELKAELVKINLRLKAIEIDLRHHIKRSDKHERWLMVLIVMLAGSAGAGIIQLVPILKGLF